MKRVINIARAMSSGYKASKAKKKGSGDKINPHKLLEYKEGWSEARIRFNNAKYWKWEADNK